MKAKKWQLVAPALSVLFVLALCPAAQGQDLVWAKRAGGSNSTQGTAIAVDAVGNSYVTGLFQGSATFGPGEANETTLTNSSPGAITDLFVAKYDASGLLVWAKRAGGSGVATADGIALDGTGNSYLTGFFHGSATFGPGEANETTLTSAGGPNINNIFVANYDTSGLLVWVKRVDGPGADGGFGIAVDGMANSYVTGFLRGSATFGSGEPNETTLTSCSDCIDLFVAKYDASGLLVWAKRAGGLLLSALIGDGIAVDGVGNSYVTGDFGGSATFGPGEANETTLTSPGTDVFVAKYDTAGLLVWVKRTNSSINAQGSSIALDATGNSYLTGFFQGSATFGPGEANETTLTSAGGASINNIFVAKYNSDGVLAWAKPARDSKTAQGSGIAVDAAGNSSVTGSFQGSATFGPGEANETTLASAGGDTSPNIFVAKYDTDGLLAWARRAGGSNSAQGSGIAVDGDGNSSVTGFFQGSATFGPGETSETLLTSSGSSDVFVAKYVGGSGVPTRSGSRSSP